MHDLIIIGGGAAGIFAALSAKEANPSLNVTVLEKSAVLLSKVRISGGGRCNVTHACFDPARLIQFYPRGTKELLGPFHRFNPSHTVAWFERNGVALKTEQDGRIFPVTDSSTTIIDCLLESAKRLHVEIRIKQKIERIDKLDPFSIHFKEGPALFAKNLLLATGSGPDGYRWAQDFGHTLQPPVPSLFTFNIPRFNLSHLSGISIDPVEIRLRRTNFVQSGPLLITHFGLSGPAVLKLSAWGARFLHACGYRTEIHINWLPSLTEESIFQTLKQAKTETPQKIASMVNPFHFPKNLWKTLLEGGSEQKLISLSDKTLRKLAAKLHADRYSLEGKTTHKEEFVTCGGVTLSEIDFKTMQSKKCPGLFFAGEILDIDGVTGGFNFQNAWTTGFIAGNK